MIIKNKELKKLLEKEIELTKGIEGAKEEVAKMTARMQEIQEENKTELDGIAKLRKKIASIFIPIVMEKTKEYEVFGSPVIKDGEIHVEIKDVRPDAEKKAIEEAIAVKSNWQEYLKKS